MPSFRNVSRAPHLSQTNEDRPEAHWPNVIDWGSPNDPSLLQPILLITANYNRHTQQRQQQKKLPRGHTNKTLTNSTGDDAKLKADPNFSSALTTRRGHKCAVS